MPEDPAKFFPPPDPDPIPLVTKWRRDRFVQSQSEGWASAIYCVKCGSLKVDLLFPDTLWCMEPNCGNNAPLDRTRFAIVGGIGDTEGQSI